MREARYRESIFMFFEDVLNLVFALQLPFIMLLAAMFNLYCFLECQNNY